MNEHKRRYLNGSLHYRMCSFNGNVHPKSKGVALYDAFEFSLNKHEYKNIFWIYGCPTTGKSTFINSIPYSQSFIIVDTDWMIEDNFDWQNWARLDYQKHAIYEDWVYSCILECVLRSKKPIIVLSNLTKIKPDFGFLRTANDIIHYNDGYAHGWLDNWDLFQQKFVNSVKPSIILRRNQHISQFKPSINIKLREKYGE